MFDFLERTARTVANVATLPVSVVVDVATLGGLATDRDESYTQSKARRIAKDGKRLIDDIAG